MALIDQLIVFVVGLLIGGLGIYLGARIIMGSRDYSYAVLTALIGALVLAVVQWILSLANIGTAGLGFIVLLLVWIAVIRSRYTTSWLNAAATAVVAWLSLVVVLFVLSAVGLTTPEALGFPPGIV